MGQEQRKVEIRMLDGSVRDGAATGNNAAWQCGCRRKLPLVGRTYQPHPRERQVVECPDCGKVYHLYPEGGQNQKRVEYVQECKKP